MLHDHAALWMDSYYDCCLCASVHCFLGNVAWGLALLAGTAADLSRCIALWHHVNTVNVLTAQCIWNFQCSTAWSVKLNDVVFREPGYSGLLQVQAEANSDSVTWRAVWASAEEMCLCGKTGRELGLERFERAVFLQWVSSTLHLVLTLTSSNWTTART